MVEEILTLGIASQFVSRRDIESRGTQANMHFFTWIVDAFLLQALLWPFALGRDVVCPRSVAFDNSTRIESSDPVKKYREISGLVVSPKIKAPSGERVVYAINDGGGMNRLGAFDSGTGKRLLTFQIPTSIITNVDWETMAIGSCGSTGESSTCIYIGDTGDNPSRVSKGKKSRRSVSTSYRILKIKEPNYKVSDGEDDEAGKILPKSKHKPRTHSPLTIAFQSLTRTFQTISCFLCPVSRFFPSTIRTPRRPPSLLTVRPCFLTILDGARVVPRAISMWCPSGDDPRQTQTIESSRSPPLPGLLNIKVRLVVCTHPRQSERTLAVLESWGRRGPVLTCPLTAL